MADIATAKKTLDALKKAHNSGDAVKAASLLGTLKVRARNARCAARSFAGAQIWRFHGRDARETTAASTRVFFDARNKRDF